MPTRQCVSCRSRKSQCDLLRISLDSTTPYLGRPLRGRSGYVCPSQVCVEALKDGRGLSRAFRAPIDRDGLAMLVSVILNGLKDQ
ncbi:MAG: YlxR family protein [Chthonomonadaceae bacterium]|nr:YlxR family protein [Chthonomonadaceae bacterium]